MARTRAGYSWRGGKVAKELRAELYKGLRMAAAQAQTYIVRAISRPSRIGGGGRRRPGHGYRMLKSSSLAARRRFTKTGTYGKGTKWSRGPGGTVTVHRRRAQGKPMQFNRSKPGQPPKRDTGGLVRSIFSSGDRGRMVANVGTTVRYGRTLEKGGFVPARRPVRKKWLVFPNKAQTGWVFTKRAKGFRLRKRPFIMVTVKRNARKLAALTWRPVREYLRRGRGAGA